MKGESRDALDLNAGKPGHKDPSAGDGKDGQEVVGEDLKEECRRVGHAGAS